MFYVFLTGRGDGNIQKGMNLNSIQNYFYSINATVLFTFSTALIIVGYKYFAIQWLV